MASTINTSSLLAQLSPSGVTSADLYARVNKTILAENGTLSKLDTAIAGDQTKLSGLGKLQSQLADFQKVAQSLDDGGLKTGASASNPAVLSALTNGNAVAGTHTIDVKQLAQAQILTARPFTAPDARLGTGTIKFSVGNGTVKTVSINSSNNTLKGITKALQDAGLDAKLTKTGGGSALTITSAEGAGKGVSIKVDGDASLQRILSLTQTKAAQDAQLTVDGKSISSASNVVTGAIKGTAIALQAKGSSSLTISEDNGQISKNLTNFVSAFNALNAKLRDLGSSSLRGNATLGQASTQLQQVASTQALSRIGVSIAGNGDLKIDSKVLQAAVTADAEAVSKQVLGVAKQFETRIGSLLGDGGAISREAASANREISTLSAKKTDLSKALTAQYSAQDNSSSGASSLFDFLA